MLLGNALLMLTYLGLRALFLASTPGLIACACCPSSMLHSAVHYKACDHTESKDVLPHELLFYVSIAMQHEKRNHKTEEVQHYGCGPLD